LPGMPAKAVGLVAAIEIDRHGGLRTRSMI
jgi:hypothetical protein